jgi:hypothetical protein
MGQYKLRAKGYQLSALHFEGAKLQEKNDICNFYQIKMQKNAVLSDRGGYIRD